MKISNYFLPSLLLLGFPLNAFAQSTRVTSDMTIEDGTTQVTGTFVVDTGASNTMMSRDTAEDSGFLDSNGDPVPGKFKTNSDGSLQETVFRMADGSRVTFYTTIEFTLIGPGTDNEVCDATVCALVKTDEIVLPDGTVSPGPNLLGRDWLKKVKAKIDFGDEPTSAIWSNSWSSAGADMVEMPNALYQSNMTSQFYFGIPILLSAGSFQSSQETAVVSSLPFSMMPTSLINSLVLNGASVSYSTFGTISPDLQSIVEVKGLGDVSVAPEYTLATLSGVGVAFLGTGFGPSAWNISSIDFIVNDEIDYLVLGSDFLDRFDIEYDAYSDVYASGFQKLELPWKSLMIGGATGPAGVVPDLRGANIATGSNSSTISLELFHAVPNSMWVLQAGLQIDGTIPFGNGFIVPSSDWNWILGATNSTGQDAQQVVVPHTIAPPGTTIYFQSFMTYTQLGGGVSASDAISVVLP